MLDHIPEHKWTNATAKAEAKWADNLIAVILWAVAIFWGSALACWGLIFGGYAAWKMLPWFMKFPGAF